jgi:hypothetical protein
VKFPVLKVVIESQKTGPFRFGTKCLLSAYFHLPRKHKKIIRVFISGIDVALFHSKGKQMFLNLTTLNELLGTQYGCVLNSCLADFTCSDFCKHPSDHCRHCSLEYFKVKKCECVFCSSFFSTSSLYWFLPLPHPLTPKDALKWSQESLQVVNNIIFKWTKKKAYVPKNVLIHFSIVVYNYIHATYIFVHVQILYNTNKRALLPTLQSSCPSFLP